MSATRNRKSGTTPPWSSLTTWIVIGTAGRSRRDQFRPWTRGVKWARRRPVAATFVALGLVAFLALTAGGILYQRYDQLAKDRRLAHVFQEQNRGVELLDQADKATTPEQLQDAQDRSGKVPSRRERRAKARPRSLSGSMRRARGLPNDFVSSARSKRRGNAIEWTVKHFRSS